MNKKKIKLLYFFAVAVLCLSFVWKHFNNENKTTVVYTTKDKEITISEKKSTETNSTVTTKSTSTLPVVSTKTTTVKATTKKPDEPLYIDINTADVESLCHLDGIGEGLAMAIICYREENGGFNNIEELMKVHGIGEGIFNAVRDYIYVENPIYPEQEIEQEDYPAENEESEDEQEYIEEIPSEESHEIPTELTITLEDVAPININSADIELLMLLPHVDEEIAGKIIELRDSIHGFSHPYELLYVEELSQEKVAEILEYVVVEEEKTE